MWFLHLIFKTVWFGACTVLIVCDGDIFCSKPLVLCKVFLLWSSFKQLKIFWAYSDGWCCWSREGGSTKTICTSSEVGIARSLPWSTPSGLEQDDQWTLSCTATCDNWVEEFYQVYNREYYALELRLSCTNPSTIWQLRKLLNWYPIM